MNIIKKFSKVLFLFYLSFPLFQVAVAQNLALNMKVLIISPKADGPEAGNLSVAKQVLRGFNIPFDVMILAAPNGELYNHGRMNFESSDGAGAYYGIIVTEQNLTVRNKKNSYSGLNPDQWNQLKNYEKNYKVRRISLSSDPANLPGLANVGVPSDQTDVLYLDQEFNKLDSSLPSNLSVPLKYTWHSMAKIIDSRAHSPFAYYGSYASGVVGRPLAGTVLKTTDGREQLHLFYAQGVESLASFALAPAWVNWLTRGTFLGKRRIYLNVHIDDLFLETDMRRSSSSAVSYKKYRLGAFDLDYFAQQRRSELAQITNNPEYRIELAFNGEGISEFGGYNQDPLYQSARKNIADYFWVSHTYTHRDLNKIKFKDADWELASNALLANTLMRGASQYFSPNSLVTPHISGLYNAQALDAMKKNGIKYIVNDMSVPKQRPAHPHTAYYTTTAVNGSDGILIMPRYATDIYYENSIPEEIVENFNRIHGGIFKRHLNFEDIYSIENDRNVPYLLNYQEAPYMFHQANLRTFNYQGKNESLVSLWIKKSLSELRKYTKLPILSVKMDDLAEIYKNKFAIAHCASSGRVVYSNGELSHVLVWANGHCRLNLTSNVTDFQRVRSEHYGPDKTVAIEVNGQYFTKFIPTEKVGL